MPPLTRPVFRPHCHVEVLDGEAVFLLSESGHRLLRGRLYALLAPLLDGRTADEAVEALAGQAPYANLYYALRQLEDRGYLVEAPAGMPPGAAAFWSGMGLDPREADGRLREHAVAVAAFGAVETGAIRGALEGLGLAVRPEGDLTVVLADDYLQEGLAAWGERAQAAGRPWLLVKPVGAELWVGPLFVPGETACWACLAQRLGNNRETEAFLHHRAGHHRPFPVSRAQLASTVPIALQSAATAAAQWLAGLRPHPLAGRILTLDVAAWRAEEHPLVRRPQCPCCGDGGLQAAREPQPVRLQSRPKGFTADGGHRTVTPSETLKRYGHHISRISGVVTRLEPTPGADHPLINVFGAGHNFAMRLDDLDGFRRHLRNKSSGKGVSEEQARASALCEAIERFSGIFQGDEPCRRATLAELGDAAIPPHEVLLFSERQYRERERWNARGSIFNRVPAPFDPSSRIDWTPLWSLTEGRFKYLPAQICYFAHPAARQEGSFARGDSNGNAAGNTLEEAVVQGFMELVERDAVALWWYNRLHRPGVDLDSFGTPYLGDLREHYRSLGRELWVLDIASDLGIPAFAALCRRPGGASEAIMIGFGAHFDPRVALLRAVTELNQMMPMVLNFDAADGPSGGSGPGEALEDSEILDWLRTATLANQPYLAPDRDRPARRAADFPYEPSADILEDVRRCQAIVESLGLEMLVLDQTRPDIGLPVVKVFVPGLRHFWARFAPGRLYDAPVRMGWLPEPLAEESLNPVPIFI